MIGRIKREIEEACKRQISRELEVEADRDGMWSESANAREGRDHQQVPEATDGADAR